MHVGIIIIIIIMTMHVAMFCSVYVYWSMPHLVASKLSKVNKHL